MNIHQGDWSGELNWWFINLRNWDAQLLRASLISDGHFLLSQQPFIVHTSTFVHSPNNHSLTIHPSSNLLLSQHHSLSIHSRSLTLPTAIHCPYNHVLLRSLSIHPSSIFYSPNSHSFSIHPSSVLLLLVPTGVVAAVGWSSFMCKAVRGPAMIWRGTTIRSCADTRACSCLTIRRPSLAIVETLK